MNYSSVDKIESVFAEICEYTIISLLFVTSLFVVSWSVYFWFRLREVTKKIHYLKRQRDQRCQDELANARVDYVKCVFLLGICLAEGVDLIVVIFLLAQRSIIPSSPTGNCTGDNTPIALYYQKSYRYSLVVTVSCTLIYTSLIHTLTSYMANAFEEKRVVRLGRREKLLLLLLFTQIAIVWLSALYWRAFLFLMLLAAITTFPIHIFFFIKYSRQLYTALKRRTLDAWFEDTQQHKKLKGMCHEYKCGSILYAVSMVLMGLTLGLTLFRGSIKIFFEDKCRLNFILGSHTEFDWPNNVYKHYQQTLDVINVIFTLSYNILATLTVTFLLCLNLFILTQAVNRQIKRRRVYNSYKGIRSEELYRPLVGNK